MLLRCMRINTIKFKIITWNRAAVQKYSTGSSNKVCFIIIKLSAWIHTSTINKKFSSMID